MCAAADVGFADGAFCGGGWPVVELPKATAEEAPARTKRNPRTRLTLSFLFAMQVVGVVIFVAERKIPSPTWMRNRDAPRTVRLLYVIGKECSRRYIRPE